MDDMQALYYVALESFLVSDSEQQKSTQRKANENRLNQNFAAISAAISELFERLYAIEHQG